MWLLTLQLFKNNIDTQRKLRLNLHSLSVILLLEYGRKTYKVICTRGGDLKLNPIYKARDLINRLSDKLAGREKINTPRYV
jgi:hypothetical protein